MKTKTIAFFILPALFCVCSSIWALSNMHNDDDRDAEASSFSATSSVFGLNPMDGISPNKRSNTDQHAFPDKDKARKDPQEPILASGNVGTLLLHGIPFVSSLDMAPEAHIVAVPKKQNFPVQEKSSPVYGDVPPSPLSSLVHRANGYNFEMNLGGSVGGYTAIPEPPLVTALASPSSTKITEETPNVIVPLTENSECGTPVPEPATMLLFGTGLAGIATKLRKRARQREAT